MSYVNFEPAKKPSKCAVIGCGTMGTSIAHALARSGLFDAMVLLDDDQRLAEGQAADLVCALDLHADVDIWAGEYADLDGCSLIVLACGLVPLHETALSDLPALNLPVVRRAVAGLAEHAGDAVLLVASQPNELMTYTALHYSGLAPSRVVGLGTLPDTLRLRRLLGRYLTADPAQVDAMILGRAGEHATVMWSGARVAGLELDVWRKSLGRSTDTLILHSLFDDVRCAATRCTDAKGHADLAGAQAAALVAEAILRDRNTLLPLCVLTDDRLGVGNLCMSLPCVLGRGGVIAMPELRPDATEQAALERSAAYLRATILDADPAT